MNENDERFIGESDGIFQVDQLSDKEIFSFLKRYYTDSYKVAQTQKKQVKRGGYLETIETLEKLHDRLVGVDDFIGYDLIDWRDACLREIEQKKKEIVSFYNGLVVDIELIKIANLYYDFSPRIDAFIRFLEIDDSCKFRNDIQDSAWKVEDFPSREVFDTLNKFRFFLKNYKCSKPPFNPDEGAQVARNILNKIKPIKQIKQILFVLKINVLNLDQEQIQTQIKSKTIIENLGRKSSSKKLQDVISLIEYHEFCRDLPWVCRLTKAELELNDEIRLMIGFVFDGSEQKFSQKKVMELIRSEVDKILGSSWLDSFITWDVVSIDQVWNHLGAGVSSEIKLPNNKKVSLMLKWYLGVFYGMNRIIKPDNYTVESRFVDMQSNIEINKRYLDKLALKDQQIKVTHTLKRSEIRSKVYDFDSIWDDKSLVKQAPEYARYLHSFYKWLGYRENLSPEQVNILQRLNLFLAYVNDACLDNLHERLSATTTFKSWPKIVRMYLSLKRGRQYELQNLNQWTVCNRTLIQKILGNDLATCVNQLSLTPSEKNLQIEMDLHELKQELKSCEKFQNLLVSKQLVQKNRESGLDYLNKRFKENVVALRFEISSVEKFRDIKSLKDTFTHFIKSAKRAPKRIGADLDSYLGYLIVEDECCYIDFTALLYIRENVSSSEVKLNLKRYWNDLEKVSQKKKIESSCHESFQSNLNLISVPLLWANNSGHDFVSVIKGDRNATRMLKNSLVEFYTAYEYFNDYKNIDIKNGKRPEFFLKGRQIEPKSKKQKKVIENQVSSSKLTDVYLTSD